MSGRGGAFTQALPLLRPYARLTRLAEAQAWWEPQEGSFSRVGRQLGVCYSTLVCCSPGGVWEGDAR